MEKQIRSQYTLEYKLEAVKQEYGWPRMHRELLECGIRVGKERVQRLMKQHGIRAKTKRKFVVTTKSRHSLPVAADDDLSPMQFEKRWFTAQRKKAA